MSWFFGASNIWRGLPARDPLHNSGENLPSGAGWGLQSYYRLGNAITEGLAGRPFGDVCPQPTDQSFKSIHAIAFRVQEATQTVSRLRYEQDRLQAELTSDKTANDRKVTIRDLLNRSGRQLGEARNTQFAAKQQFNAMSADMRRRGINQVAG